jgi:hypothetical protein
MIKRTAGLLILVGLIALGLSRCGSSTPSVAAGQTGGLVVEIGDVPLCNILSFRGLVTALTLKSAVTTGVGQAVLSTNAAIWVDFGNLEDASTILSQTSVSPATYVGGTITVNAPTMTVFDPTESPPLTTITPTFSQETNIPFTISPPLVVTANKTSVLQVDFSIPQSVETTAGQINITGASGSATVQVKPVFTSVPLTANAAGNFPSMDDVSGYTSSISTTSENAKYIGSFVLQTLSGSTSTATGPAVTVYLNSNSQLMGASALNQITTGNFTEVNGYIDMNGNFVANTAVVEDQSVLADYFSTFIGTILSVQKDSQGHVIQLQMSVRDEEPNTGNGTGNPVELDSPPLIVNISPSAGFHFSSPSTNFANLVPDSTYLAVGQQIAAEGTYTPPPSSTSTSSSSSSSTSPSTSFAKRPSSRASSSSTPSSGTSSSTTPSAQQATVSAQDVYLHLQTLMGNFSSLAAVGSDNLSGGFVLSPCSTIFQGVPIYVITDGQTNFANVEGLSGLTSVPSLEIRGSLFFDQQGGTIENVQIPPGSLVMLASQVDQL